jgi:capsular polysaccharide export protein
MKSLALFAASRDQRRYFTALAENTAINTNVVWYKSLSIPTLLTWFPMTKLWEQATVLTTRKRYSRKGKDAPEWIWPVFTSVTFIQAIWFYGVYSRWLKQESATYIGMWNGKKFRQAILALALPAYQKQGLYFETGPLPGMSSIDPQGINFASSSPNNIEFYLNRSLVGSVSETLYHSKTEKPNTLPEAYIFVPFQVVEDSNIYLFSPWIRDMRQLFVLCKTIQETVKKEQGKTLTFVFKEHPACDEQYDDLKAQQTEQLQFMNEMDTSVLIEHASAIVTINSTVGLEGLMARKKVLVLGGAQFGIEGISYPVSSEAVLQDCLSRLDALSVNEQAIAHFIDYLKHDYAIAGNAMKSPDATHWQAAEQKLKQLMSE